MFLLSLVGMPALLHFLRQYFCNMKLSTYLIIAASYSKLIFFSGFMKVLRRQVDMR